MEKIRLGIFASGSGTTGEVIFDKAVVVLTNNPEAGVIDLAKKHNVACEVLPPRSEFRIYNPDGGVNKELSSENYGNYIIKLLEKYQITHGSLNGFDTLMPENVTEKFLMVNSHPGPLDPGFLDFGGVGMHGLAVHQAVLEFSKMIKNPFPFKTAVCLHLVNKEFDKGKLVSYKEVEVKEDDSAESLQTRVKEAEKIQNKEFWNRVEQNGGKLVVISRYERVIFPGEEKFLEEAKIRAIAMYPKG
ncbi:MAG: formyltransferase family protein [Candidatus Daviesbacteria bacterium]|nr:formyltransferase family protein [Candidatus Daviesbacteria bacterium]